MFQVPAQFAANIAQWYGEAGREWLSRAPAIVKTLCSRWELEIDGETKHGGLSLAIPTRRVAEASLLKIGLKDESTQHEALALATWKGEGAVLLLAEAPEMGAMLLERLNASCSLNDIPLDDAVPIAGSLLRRLAIPSPAEVPKLREIALRFPQEARRRWEKQGRPIPENIIKRAASLATELAPSVQSLLVNYDLIYEDVLSGEREEWLVVDPKVVAGDPEYGVAQLLWRRLEEMEEQGGLTRHFDRLVAAAELDAARARAWTFVRCVDYWLWGLSVGLTEDPKRCNIICEWLER